MRRRWLVIRDGLGIPAFNMALDEALLEAAPQTGVPVVRFYGWAEPAATFGYTQRLAEAEAATALRPLIRRPTGGGLVPHDADWTYSAVFPPGHFWHRLRAADSYERIHAWLRESFARLGVPAELSPCRRQEAPGRCFAGAEKSDLLWCGKKIAGAAQRRTRNGLLIQGSVQPPPLNLSRAAWETAFCAAGTEQQAAAWEEWTPDGALSVRAMELAAQKYSQSGYNGKR